MSDDDGDDRIDALGAEVAAQRKEMAHGFETVGKKLDAVNASPQEKATDQLRRTNNRMAAAPKFNVPIGPGAEDLPRFAHNWVTLLKSELGSKHFREAFAKGIIKTINNQARDLEPTDAILVCQAIEVANGLGKVKPIDDEAAAAEQTTDEESSDVDERSDDEPPVDPRAAKKAAAEAAKALMARKLKALRKRVNECWWQVMDDAERAAYIKEMLSPDDPIEQQMRSMTQKARSNVLYPLLKKNLREAAPHLVPLTDNVSSDKQVYKASKKALPGYEERASKWPRCCKLVMGTDEHGDPSFLFVKESDTEGVPDELDQFYSFVVATAKWAGIKLEDITENLVAFHLYIANQIAGTAVRSRGHVAKLKQEVQGDLADHSQWNKGIRKALKFMKDRKLCPTSNPLISKIQKKKKATKKSI